MSPQNQKYFETLNNWKEEIILLREIILETQLDEDHKWKHPCYTFNKKNVLILHSFKTYCAISFFKGVLLNDKDKILIQPSTNSNEARQLRFTSIEQVKNSKDIIKKYIFEAIQIEQNGEKVPTKKVTDFMMPVELIHSLEQNKELELAFNKLTPGRQKGYILYFSNAKQSSTRYNRINKLTPRILQGKGLNDCTCGLSKRMPSCDGSHKNA